MDWNEFFLYEAGNPYRKKARGSRAKAGALAGVLTNTGYVRHHNEIDNLRKATNAQNTFNKSKTKRNTSGYKGVCWHTKIGKWHAQIQFEGQRMHLGYYDDIEEARVAYEAVAKSLFEEYKAE